MKMQLKRKGSHCWSLPKKADDLARMPKMKNANTIINTVASEVTIATADFVADSTMDQLSDEALSLVSLETTESEFEENETDIPVSQFNMSSGLGTTQFDEEIGIDQLWPEDSDTEPSGTGQSQMETEQIIQSEGSTSVNAETDTFEPQTHSHTINITFEILTIILQRLKNGTDGKTWLSKTEEDLKSYFKDGQSLRALKDT